jgi:hypothetical protein
LNEHKENLKSEKINTMKRKRRPEREGERARERVSQRASEWMSD